ncbi:Outer membrane protein beta-barrel domain-containing protein [Yoonia tamlensis]|uniref:Outer membrane protein beta-barrel domain-containing protein n=1 Tax=Yoonia tamlensis TaxID=390270 RepID=A0A1I6GL00_9RHOB|nr:outer membrane beta-barrel protein [Yoonia tamlensis]SFR42821.1 Outer membrane protein beta-barrel domain-containing protein [Yoonia tamlensis]
MKFDRNISTGLVSVAALAAAGSTAAAQNFDGTYVGMYYGAVSGDYPSTSSSEDYAFEDQTAFGVFAGKNWSASGNLTAGLEVALQTTNTYEEDSEYYLNHLTDVKFKVGTEFALSDMPVLVYGFAGVSLGSATAEDGDEPYLAIGGNLGFGADVKVSDMLSVGIEHTQREMSSHYTDDNATVGNGTTSFRAAIHF